MRFLNDPDPFSSRDLPGADHVPDRIHEDLSCSPLDGAQPLLFESGKNFRSYYRSPLGCVSDFIGAECMDMDPRRHFVDPVHHIDERIKRETGVNPGEEAYLGHVSFERELRLCLDSLAVVAVRPFIARFPAKSAETTEVLADVGNVQVLVPHVRYSFPDTLFAHLIGRREDPVNGPVPCREKHDCL